MILQRLGVVAASTVTAVGGMDVIPHDGTDTTKTLIGLGAAILVQVLFGLYKKIVGKKKKKAVKVETPDYSNL